MTADAGRLVTFEDWVAVAQRTLRGRGVAELSSVTRDGIEVRPLYTDGPAPPAAARAADPARTEYGWDARVCHHVDAGAVVKLAGELGPVKFMESIRLENMDSLTRNLVNRAIAHRLAPSSQSDRDVGGG